MSAIDIEEYVQTWTKAPRLHRLFADILTTSPKFAELKPEEIEPKKEGIKASDVAGAVSTLVLGVGWKRVNIPTSIVKFGHCPVFFATFAVKENNMESNFYFPVQCNLRIEKSGIKIGVAQISLHGANLEYKRLGKFPNVVQELENDNLLTKKLTQLYSTGLIATKWVGTVNYETKGSSLFGELEMNIDYTKKKWNKAIEEMRLKPEGFVENVMNIACSVAEHVQTYSAGKS